MGLTTARRHLLAPAGDQRFERSLRAFVHRDSEASSSHVPHAAIRVRLYELVMSDQDASNLYSDESNRPRLVPSCVLFWDVLGIKAMAQAKSGLDSLQSLLPALGLARERSNTKETSPMRAISWFTDNVVAGTPVSKHYTIEMVLGLTQIDVAYMNLLMLDAGFLARGAISFGHHYMDESFVFGPALVEAVDLEGRTRYPRVALSETAADLNRHFVRENYEDPLDSPQVSGLVIDGRGEVFVNHLGVWLDEEDDPSSVEFFLPRYKSIIEAAMEEHQFGEVFDKWKWLADFHNCVMEKELRDPKPFLIEAGRGLHTFTPFSDTI